MGIYQNLTNINVDIDLKKNETILKEVFKDANDIIFRNMKVGQHKKLNILIFYVDGMTTKDSISEYAIQTLMESINLESLKKDSGKELQNEILNSNIAITELGTVQTLQECVDKALSGETILFIETCSKAVWLSSRGWQIRGIQEPAAETLIRGARDGFIETMKVNITLIRRRIRDPKLKVKYMQVGRRSKTDITLLYIEDIVNKTVLDEVEKRINNIDIEAVLESSYIEELIEDDTYSPFPQIENTERPDAAASALLEGRVVIAVDNTPTVLMAPATFISFMQSSEDYYERWMLSCLIRMIRYIALPIVMLLPALYVAVVQFHPNMLPTQLALYVAASRANVPFPPYFEALLMELVMELVREASIRITTPVGSTIGLVSGLVIGSASVEAGLITPIAVIIVALTGLASFAIPSYNFSTSLRMIRFGFIVIASFFGLFGISIGLCILIIHLCTLKSFGVPYLTPMTHFVERRSDLKDTVIRPKIYNLVRKPAYLQVEKEKGK
ncbi:spore germination protein [Sedimentibacter hydroxybenzoicus DSM 7310]|uniref:Spore germination protein n=1 Tax=Sedimentibacter hydroxybenzoicus DSM 7310 TaxID=1123245 RepID=A0A974BMH8_SEDHY|nr:spore germination protein [Sedimentibacter hydroxybenzoicus]NYB75422.1 spore germination protein [Sedimentibacter hydroxybenzoicus DSM 7310]